MMNEHVKELLIRARGGKPALAEYYSANFAAFIRAAWKNVLRPDEKLIWCWAYNLWAEHLTQVRDGACRRLIINCPPRFLKSIIVSVCFAAWIWTRRPQATFLFASYSMDLSVEHNIARR